MAYNQVFVNNFGSASLADGYQAFQLGGKQGEGLVSEVHGKWYTGGYRGNVYVGSTPGAGITVPGLLATAAKFVLYNPLTSGKNLELINFSHFNVFMIGSFVAFGVPASEAVIAVLAYRAISFWLPTLPGIAGYLALRRTVHRWER